MLKRGILYIRGMQIIRVDEQGFALSDEDIEKLAGSNLWMEMMKNRVIIQSRGFEQEIMKEIDITNYYYIEQVDKKGEDWDGSTYLHPTEPNVADYIHRIWFASPVDKENFMQILAMKKLLSLIHI